jgi:hypothetical protein
MVMIWNIGIRNRTILAVSLIMGALTVVSPIAVMAETIDYFAILQQSNNSGVSGMAFLALNSDGQGTPQTLTVRIDATGLEPNVVHPAHIHGPIGPNGTSLPAMLPSPALDTDRDGFIETPEAERAVGPPLLSLTAPPGGNPQNFPAATSAGTLQFQETYNLNDPTIYEPGVSKGNLFPLDFRAIELHGLTVAAGVGAGTPGEVNGIGGYKMDLPVAGGPIQLVPEPSSLLLISTGFLAMAWLGLRRSRARSAA